MLYLICVYLVEKEKKVVNDSYLEKIIVESKVKYEDVKLWGIEWILIWKNIKFSLKFL